MARNPLVVGDVMLNTKYKQTEMVVVARVEKQWFFNSRIALVGKKAPSSVFESVKNFCSSLGAFLS